MRQRGRKSLETLAATATESAEPKPRLDPPDCLGAREVVEVASNRRALRIANVSARDPRAAHEYVRGHR